MENCTFCHILNSLEPAAVIFDDRDVIVLLDKKPLFHGHSLVIPKMHYETLNDLPVSHMQSFFTRVKETALVVEKAMQAQGTFVAINNKVSQSVPHLHVHVVPRTKGDGLKGFFWPRTRYQNDEMAVTLRVLQKTWSQLIGN